jgi:agmatinase
VLEHVVKEANVIGFELVELHPALDPTYATTVNSAHIVKACLVGLAMNKKGLTDPHYLSPIASEHAIDNYYGDQEEFLRRTQELEDKKDEEEEREE